MNPIQQLNITEEIYSIKSLLVSVELPDSDLNKALIQFFGIKESNYLIATGALEIYDINAILRSVAVLPAYQNSGIGKQMSCFLEKKAIELGIVNLFLLTTTAEKFFRRLNYRIIPRELCPEEIKASTQFTEICPSSASCMYKNLMT